MLTNPLNTVPDAILTILPDFFSIMAGTTARAHSNGPRTLTAITRSHSSLGISWNGLLPRSANSAALLTRISTVPNALSVLEIKDSTEAFEVTLASQNSALPCPASIRATVADPSRTSATTTLAPAEAQTSQQAAPMPRPPPGTLGTLS